MSKSTKDPRQIQQTCATFTWCKQTHEPDEMKKNGHIWHCSADVESGVSPATLVLMASDHDPESADLDEAPTVYLGDRSWSPEEAVAMATKFHAAVIKLARKALDGDRIDTELGAVMAETQRIAAEDGLGQCPPWCTGKHDDSVDARHHSLVIGDVPLEDEMGSRSKSDEPVGVSLWANSFDDDTEPPESVINLRVGGGTAGLVESTEWLTVSEARRVAALLLRAVRTIQTGLPS